MSSNIPHKIPQSGIPKPSSSSTASTTASSSLTTTTAKFTSASQQSSVIGQQARKMEAVKRKGSDSSNPPAESIAATPQTVLELEAKYKLDIEALTESTEMATIEKEIAEEKLDNCERELQETKDKLAEATLQIEMLKGEQQANLAVTSGTSDSAVTVFQLQKVEEQNELLKQALIKLRDISAKDKKSLEDLQVEHEELQVKLLDLEEKEQKYLDQIKVFGEQIDANQSAQEMVEKLSQQKTELEDKLRECIEELDGMEKLQDYNNQIIEMLRKTEIDLNGDIDGLRVQYAELGSKKRDIEDYLSDQERTVTKLKEENRMLNDQVTRLKDQFREGESIEQQKHQIENVAYKLNFSESKMAEKEAEIARYRRNLSEMEEQMNSLSLITKEQSARIDDFKFKYEAKVSENSELQRALRRKMEEVSELEIRRKMAEKKLQTFQKDTETKLTNLSRTIETMKGIEVQHEEDIKRLMEDNEIIERERRELRDQLNKSNRSLERSMQTGNLSLSMMTAQENSLASLGISFQTNPSNQTTPIHHPHQNLGLQHLNQSQQQQNQISQIPSLGLGSGNAGQATAPVEVDEPVLMTRIRDLTKAFDRINRKNYELEVELAQRELDNRVKPNDFSSFSSYYDIDRAKSLRAEVERLKRQVRASIINQKICTKSRSVYSQARNDNFNNSKLAFRYQLLANEASSLMSNSSLARGAPKATLMHSTPVK